MAMNTAGGNVVMLMKALLLGVLATGLAADPAFAQITPPSRVFVSINGAYQVTTNDFADGASKRENGEDGRFDTMYEVKGGPALDIAGGGMVWRRLGVGIGVSRLSVATPAAVTATIPHPFFFNASRTVTGDAPGLKREEFAVHVQLRASAPIGNRFEAMVFGGPSFFQVKQGLVTSVIYAEAYPFDVATFSSATTTVARRSTVGFNVGGELNFFFTTRVGVGATMQYSDATLQLPVAGGGTRDV
ncbi:MAG: hypothetical protein ABL982_21570, partial [Vicinamibacterales bacterium]